MWTQANLIKWWHVWYSRQWGAIWPHDVTVCGFCATYWIWIIDHACLIPYYLSAVFPLLITFSFPVLLLCRTTIRCVCVWQRPPFAAPPAPSCSWEVTQFPMIQCGCFCCVGAGAVLRGPLMPTVTVLWIMDRESDRVLDRGGEREGMLSVERGRER